MRTGDEITFGFDGSRKRHFSTTDATALVGCRVSDGHFFIPTVGGSPTVWEPPPGGEGKGWEAPTLAIDSAVRQVLDRYNFVGFYADPSLWDAFVAGWERDFGARARVKVSAAHPFTWPVQGAKRVTQAVERLQAAILRGELTHDGSPILRAHILNAHQSVNSYGITMAKENPSSSRKIDAAFAAVLAWAARLDALARPRDGGTGKAMFV